MRHALIAATLLVLLAACAPREGSQRGAYVGAAGGVSLQERPR